MKLTQEGLANLLNGKKSLVSNYENGYSTPDINTLVKLADIFDISHDELVGSDFKKKSKCSFLISLMV